MKRVTIALVACAVVLGLVGSAGATSPASSPAKKKINKNTSITIDVGNATATQLDPHLERNSSELPFGMMLYDRLVHLNNKVELEPQLATKWSFSTDGLSFTATIRGNAVFHDGSAVTADAVKQSIERAQTIPQSTAKANLTMIDSVQVVGTNQVKFNLNRPAADLPYVLARNAGAIINPKAIAQNLDLGMGDQNMAGSGSYIATEWVPTVKAIFTRASTKYWDKKAGRIKTINILMSADPNTALNGVQSGQADASLVHTSLIDAARNVSGKKLYEYPTQGSYNLLLKTTRSGPVSNLKFRQALASAIDRKTISEQLLNNTCKAADQPNPPGTLGSATNFKYPFAFNVTKAKQLLSDSGVGANPEITLQLGASLEPQTSIGTALVAEFKAIGVNVNVTTAAVSVITSDFTQGKYDAYVQVNAGQGYPTLWFTRYITPGAVIYKVAGGPEGAAFETLVKSANDPTLSDSEAQKLWNEINDTFAQNAWSIPICYDTRYWIFPKDVKGVANMSYVWAVGWEPRYLTRTKKA